jgi:hypothetical protein
MASPPWLPEHSIYLELAGAPTARPARPLNQGDVFVDVPIATVGRDAEKPKVNVGPALLLGHPCSIHAGRRIIETQLVAAVRHKAEAVSGSRTLEPPWDSYYYLFPLPGLIDGEDFVADFRRVGTTHFKNLGDRRIACLTQDGWAALQRRWAWHTLRADLPLSSRSADLAGLWNELQLWEEWNSRDQAYEEFPVWLGQPQEGGAYAGTTRRDLMDYAMDELMDELPAGREGGS